MILSVGWLQLSRFFAIHGVSRKVQDTLTPRSAASLERLKWLRATWASSAPLGVSHPTGTVELP